MAPRLCRSSTFAVVVSAPPLETSSAPMRFPHTYGGWTDVASRLKEGSTADGLRMHNDRGTRARHVKAEICVDRALDRAEILL